MLTPQGGGQKRSFWRFFCASKIPKSADLVHEPSFKPYGINFISCKCAEGLSFIMQNSLPVFEDCDRAFFRVC